MTTRGPRGAPAEPGIPGREAYLDTVPLDPRAGDAPAPPLAPGAELIPGAHVGRYVVLKKVGAGGMGAVYAAYDEQLDRRVALKVLSASVRESEGSGSAAMRLQREAQAVAKLSHPNVIAAFEVGTLGDQLFLAMEYVDGATLRAWRTAQPRTTPEIVAMYVQAGRGLEAAHAAGVLHRDFKPDNVVVDAKGRPRVLDFGLARIDKPIVASSAQALEATAVALTAPVLPLTQYGSLVGTPAYMAPEQLRGERADAKSDQFSFCVALFEALYGDRPHAGNSIAELRDSVRENRVITPTAGADVPRRIRAALLRGLRADPAERFPGMGELLAALEDALPARGKNAVPVAAVLGVIAIGLAAASFAFARRSHADRCEGAERLLAGAWDDAVRARVRGAFAAASPGGSQVEASVERALDSYADAWVKMRTESCVATRVREEQSEQVIVLRTACLDARLRDLRALTTELASADLPLVLKAPQAAAELTSLAPCADVAALTAVTPLPTDPSALARVREGEQALSRAVVEQHLGRDARAVDFAAQALAAAVAAGFTPLEAKALNQHALGLKANGDPKGAEAELSKAFAKSIVARDDALATEVATNLAQLDGVDFARPIDGLRWAEIGRATLARAGNDEGLRADLLRTEARVHYEQGDGKGAAAIAEEALAIAERLYGKESFRVATFLDSLGAAYSRHERHQDARDAFAHELAILLREVGDGHPKVAAARANLGIEEMAVGDFGLARAQLEQAVDVLTRVRGPNHPDVALVLDSLGSAMASLGDCKGAVPIAQRAVAINDAAFGPDYGDTTAILTSLGMCQAVTGDLTGALVTLERGYALAKKADVDAVQGAQVGFTLAKVLVQKDPASKRARSIAREAEERFAKAEAPKELEEVRGWIREHP